MQSTNKKEIAIIVWSFLRRIVTRYFILLKINFVLRKGINRDKRYPTKISMTYL